MAVSLLTAIKQEMIALHEMYMKRALELAVNGWGTTNPNPLVGAVIVKDGWIVSEGFHEKPGSDHAETAAIKNARQNIKGSTLYVNLEPCSHYGRTPPCVRAIIEAGISEVVIGMEDPNPLVSGRGVQMLKEAGIRVTLGVLHNEAAKLNEIFIKYITQKSPFVIMKSAMSLDGKISTAAGESKWISSDESRRYVHQLRNRVSAVMVGTNTVLTDNPNLTTRLEGKSRNAVRVILDRTAKLPEESNVFKTAKEIQTIVFTSSHVPVQKIERLESLGVKVLQAVVENGRISLKHVMKSLYDMQIDSVLIEGGGELNYSALEAGIVDKVFTFVAPIIIGGRESPTPVQGTGFNSIEQSLKLKSITTRNIGCDIMIEGYISEPFFKEEDKGEKCVYRHCGGDGCCKGC